MKNATEIKIKLTIQGKSFELSVDEVKELHSKLEEVIAKSPTYWYTPYPAVTYTPTIVNPTPSRQWEITCGSDTVTTFC